MLKLIGKWVIFFADNQKIEQPKIEDQETMPNLTEDVAKLKNKVEDDIFDVAHLMTHYKNRRKHVRYVRKDITASISQADIFGTHSMFSYSRFIMVKLLDISSRGALISCPDDIQINIKIKKKIHLTLVFDLNKKFEIPARIVRTTHSTPKMYGIRFEQINHELGDYLLETQTDLVFK